MLYDKDIREPLFDFLETVFPRIRILEEKQMGRSRADILMILPDVVAGIEIKSDADSYARLARQVKDYDRFFDRNYVVVGTSHAAHIEEHVPEWWGIITVEEADVPDFYVLRRAHPNPKADRAKKLELLWRPELAHIQQINGMPEYKRKSKAFVAAKILETVPGPLLDRQISQELFERDYQTIADVIDAYRQAAKPASSASGRKRTRKRIRYRRRGKR